MAELQYDRIVRVHVANILLEDIRIDGDIETHADDEQDSGELILWNVRRSTYEQIRQKGQRVVVETGYASTGAERLFVGIAQRIWKHRGDTSFQVRIQLGDQVHSEDVRGGNTEHTFSGTVSTREIATRLAQDMGLEVGPLDAIPANDTRTDFRATGQSRESMKRLVAETDGLGFMSSGGVARFTMRAQPQSDGVRIVTSPSSGLIGTPELEEDGRMSATLLLNPSARVGGQLVVEGSEYIEPTPYTIVGVNHTFSNWTGKYLSMLDCVPPNYNPNPSANNEATP